MARKRFKAEQIVAILREVERAGDRQEVVRKHGISDQTFDRGSTWLMPRRCSAPRVYRGAALSPSKGWKRKYGGLGESLKFSEFGSWKKKIASSNN